MPTLPKSAGWMGDPKRGAALGRLSTHADNPLTAVKLNLVKIRINLGGYDSGGAYWGVGTPLYWATNADGSVDEFFRAADRDAAKAHLRKLYPNATFYR